MRTALMGLVLLSAGFVFGCSEPAERSLGDGDGDGDGDGELVLAPLTQLRALDAEEDPLADHRPAVVDCNALTGWYVEDGALEVNTIDCTYLALEEPAASAGTAGQIVHTELSYFDLTAPEPAEAHVAFLVDGVVAWDATIPIPGPGDVLDISFPLPKDVAVGAKIGLHLHNHGQNTWNFTPLVLEPALSD